MEFEIDDNLKVLEGVYRGYKGKIISLAGKDVPRRIGAKVRHPEGKPMPSVIWFKPEEVEITKKE